MINSSLFYRVFEKLELDEASGCWNFRGATQKGYGAVNDNGTVLRAHRVVLEYLLDEEIPSGEFVLHSCDNRLCCNPEHLRIGSAKDNSQDMVKRGRHKKAGGSPPGSYNATLTVEKVNEMRRRARAGETQKALGLEFGVSQSVAGDAICGFTWQHAEEPPLPRRGWGPGKRKS